jgi:hypothetical protein
VRPDIKDASQHVELLESDLQLTGVRDSGLLRPGRAGKEEYKAEDRIDKLLANIPSLLLLRPLGLRRAGAGIGAINYWANWILNGTLSSTQ